MRFILMICFIAVGLLFSNVCRSEASTIEKEKIFTSAVDFGNTDVIAVSINLVNQSIEKLNIPSWINRKSSYIINYKNSNARLNIDIPKNHSHIRRIVAYQRSNC